MAVFRVEKNDNYTVMSNVHLQDGNLSLKAKGLLSLILSLPDEWDLTQSGLVSLPSVNEGKDAVKGALKELMDRRYIIRRKVRDGSKFGGIEYTVFEAPKAEIPKAGNPQTENPKAENPPQENTNKENTNNKKKNIKKKKYGELENVLLTDEEYHKLQVRFPDTFKAKIDNLSYYIGSKGNKYKSHYLTILKWERDKQERESSAKEKGKDDDVYSRF